MPKRTDRPKYFARPGSPLNDAQAALIGDEIESARAAGRAFTPKALVKTAATRSHPLHKLFQWDDKKAGDAHRIETARNLIGAVVVMEIRVNRLARAVHAVKVTVESDVKDRRYMVRREMNLGQREHVGARYFSTIRSAIREVESLGLPEKSSAWAEIARAVNKHTDELGPEKD